MFGFTPKCWIKLQPVLLGFEVDIMGEGRFYFNHFDFPPLEVKYNSQQLPRRSTRHVTTPHQQQTRDNVTYFLFEKQISYTLLAPHLQCKNNLHLACITPTVQK